VELSRGDIIGSNTPTLLVYPDRELSTAEREEFLKIAVEQLPEESKKAYYRLMGIYGDKTMRVQDRLKANAFEMQVGCVMHLASFPEASRIDHDCAPKYVPPPFSKLIFAYQYFKNEVK
jgi:ribosomal RNA assembly protein